MHVGLSGWEKSGLDNMVWDIHGLEKLVWDNMVWDIHGLDNIVWDSLAKDNVMLFQERIYPLIQKVIAFGGIALLEL